MKNEWSIITPHHNCFWRDNEAWPVLCTHEENSSYCSEDYCPIKEPVKPSKTKPKIATAAVMLVFKGSPKGSNFKTIQAATGLKDKKLRNIIFRLSKDKKIKRVRRGLYTLSE